MKRRYAAFPVTLVAALSIGGCGQKGPLFLPGDRSEVQTELPELESLSRDTEDNADEGASEAADADSRSRGNAGQDDDGE